MGFLYDVTVWKGSRLIATAENIVAYSEREAAKNGLRAISSRGRQPRHWKQLEQLRKHMSWPDNYAAPDEVRIYAAKKPRGVKVVG